MAKGRQPIDDMGLLSIGSIGIRFSLRWKRSDNLIRKLERPGVVHMAVPPNLSPDLTSWTAICHDATYV
jgi:hypothetical protein